MVRRCALHSRIRGPAAAAMGILLGVLLGVAQPGMAGLRAAYREPVGGNSRTAAQPLTDARTHRATSASQSTSERAFAGMSQDTSQSASEGTSRGRPSGLGHIAPKSSAVHGMSGSGSPSASSDPAGATHERARAAGDTTHAAGVLSGADVVHSTGWRGAPVERAPPEVGSAA
ncbi:hypothetical protein ABN028_23735 [Actinopolymorpha sp. B17G11]|uniref:hypothetical protein n=1 Tax=Actinopolymorpha sp. B17G11 TaxID=3160861 RepID=UPI0032E415CA